MSNQDNVFTKEFWIRTWENQENSDTKNVHKGFSTPEFWDKASLSYNKDNSEISSRNIEKSIEMLKRNNVMFPGIKVLEVGCGTGSLARELAKQGADVTAIDFSQGMLERSRMETPGNLKEKIDFILMNWKTADIRELGWKKKFDLSIAFMSPAISTPETLFKFMETSKNACAVKGWAEKRNHPILDALWEKIMGKKLEDRPQNLMIKFNLLFSMGLFPEISFNSISWEQKLSMDEELDSRVSFFKKVSDKPESEIKKIIRDYLESIAENNTITRKHRGTTGTIFWKTVI
ncbi:MAG: class I SAM-dependent methyltransferase [Thermodesulfobacteriota bacterium]|nr:class I SAM-dependent methyltransferase [Thermodesulfobacteriota bacterium]